MNEDKSARYHRLKRRAAGFSVALNAVLLALLLASGGSVRLRDVAIRASGAEADAAGTIFIYVFLLVSIQVLLALPLAIYDGFLLERRYGLSTESRGEFVRDYLKAALVNMVLALAATEIVYASMREWPRAWWLASSSAFACGIALLAG